MEWHGGVDGVVGAGTVVIVILVLEDVDRALASAITLAKDAVLVARVALVVSASEAVHVGFHDVELGASSLRTGASATVLEWIVNVVGSWHLDAVEGGDTPTAHLAKVDVVLEVATEHVGGEVLGRIKAGAL